jgi:hypothetical protein
MAGTSDSASSKSSKSTPGKRLYEINCEPGTPTSTNQLHEICTTREIPAALPETAGGLSKLLNVAGILGIAAVAIMLARQWIKDFGEKREQAPAKGDPEQHMLPVETSGDPLYKTLAIGGAVAALALGGSTLAMNKPEATTPVETAAWQNPSTSLQGNTGTITPVQDGTEIGSRPFHQAILSRNRMMIGSDPTDQEPAYYVAEDGSLRPRLQFAKALHAQSALLSASRSRLSAEEQLAAVRQAAAEGHQATAQ